MRPEASLLRISADVADAQRKPKLHLAFDLPETPLQRIVGALPKEFIPLLPGLKIDGALRWPVTIDLDMVAPGFIRIDSHPEARGLQVLSLGNTIDFAELRASHSYAIRSATARPASVWSAR